MIEIPYDRRLGRWVIGGLEFDDKRTALIAWLAEQDLILTPRVLQLMERYPELGDRPLAAGELAAQDRVKLIEGGGPLVAEVQTDREGLPSHLVNFLHVQKIFTCDCQDFKYNLKAIRMASGCRQQPCKHILATALAGWDRWGYIFIKEAHYA